MLAQPINLKERDRLGDAGIEGGNIKINLKETGCVNQIYVVRYRVKLAGSCEHSNETGLHILV
jgi:hypothetical protein